MTLAVCFTCGSRKTGAWVRCDECHTTPSSEHDIAVSLILTDHYQDAAALNSLGTKIREGSRVTLKAEDTERILAKVRADPQTRPLLEFLARAGGMSGFAAPPPARGKTPWWRASLDRVLGRERVPLVEVVEVTSMTIFKGAAAQVRDLIRQKNLEAELGSDPTQFSEAAWELIFELMVFALHWSDRIAFAELGGSQRAAFMGELLRTVASNLAQSILVDTSATAQGRFRESFVQRYSERQKLYGALSLESGQGAGLSGSLFWEAAKRTAKDLFPDNEAAATLTLLAVLPATTETLQDLRSRLKLIEW